MVDVEELGTLPKNSIPDAIQHTFYFSNGDPRDLTDYTVKVYIKKPDASEPIERDADIDDAPNGIVRYKFQDDDLAVKDKNGRGTQFQFVAESENKRHISKIAEINLASTFASNAVVD